MRSTLQHGHPTSSAGMPPLPAGADGQPSYEELTARVCALAAANFALRARADRDGLIVDSATDYAIITLDMGGQITGWNTGAQRLLGHALTDVLGQSGAIVFTPEDRANGVFVDELWRAFERGSARNERWHLRRDGSRFWASGSMMPLLDGTGMVCGFLNVMRDGTAAAQAEAHRAFLLDEARHKSKNTFATVQAVAARHLRMGGRTDERPEGRAGGATGDSLMAKLTALARSHELLDSAEATLAEVLERALAPYVDEPGQTWTFGPPVPLNGRTAAALNSILHELATNAAKYGAFSVPGGQVAVTWEAGGTEAKAGDGEGSARGVTILWRESGGPAVSAPTRRGFGTRVIEGQMSGNGGRVELDFLSEGVTCRIRLPPDCGP